MSYRIIGPTDQYAGMGAEAALAVDDLTDMDEAAVEEMLEEAEENMAYVEEVDGDDDGEGDEPEYDQIVDDDDLDGEGDEDEEDPEELDFDHGTQRSNDDGKSYVIQFPGRPVEVYSTDAIWRTFRTAWKKIA